MSHYFEDMDLTSNTLNVMNIHYLVFLKHFDGYFLTSQGVSSHHYLTESTFSKISA